MCKANWNVGAFFVMLTDYGLIFRRSSYLIWCNLPFVSPKWGWLKWQIHWLLNQRSQIRVIGMKFFFVERSLPSYGISIRLSRISRVSNNRTRIPIVLSRLFICFRFYYMKIDCVRFSSKAIGENWDPQPQVTPLNEQFVALKLKLQPLGLGIFQPRSC